MDELKSFVRYVLRRTHEHFYVIALVVKRVLLFQKSIKLNLMHTVLKFGESLPVVGVAASSSRSPIGHFL